MVFKMMAVVMGGIIAMFALSVDVQHAVYAALVPGAAALGMILLSSD